MGRRRAGCGRRWQHLLALGTLAMMGWAAGPAGAQDRPADTSRRVRTAVTRGVSFLSSVQAESGEFPLDVCQELAMATCRRDDSHTVITSLILYNLRFVRDRAVRASIRGMAERGLRFIEGEMEPDGVWSPTPRHHAGHALLQVPAIQDTCVNALTLQRYGRPVVETAKRVRSQENADGIFYSFFGAMDPPLPPDQDPVHPSTRELARLIDPVVNSNALMYLALQGQQLPRLCEYLNGVVAAGLGPGYSAMFPSPYVLAYSLTNTHEAGVTCVEPSLARLRTLTLQGQREDGSWGGSLDTALAVITLLIESGGGPEVEAGVAWLLQAQAPDGSWPRELLFLVPASNWHYGSAAATTGFVLEALGRYATARRMTP